MKMFFAAISGESEGIVYLPDDLSRCFISCNSIRGFGVENSHHTKSLFVVVANERWKLCLLTHGLQRLLDSKISFI